MESEEYTHNSLNTTSKEREAAVTGYVSSTHRCYQHMGCTQHVHVCRHGGRKEGMGDAWTYTSMRCWHTCSILFIVWRGVK